jgi:hypothetical protein
MTGTATRSSACSAGDGRGTTGARQYHASVGLGGPSAVKPSPARAIRHAAWVNFRLIVAFGGCTIIEGNANGESQFNARFRDELLNGEIFYTLKEAQIIIEECRNCCS